VSKLEALLAKPSPGRVPFRTLGEVGEFIRGNGLQKKDLVGEGVPAVHYGQIHTHYGVWATETKSFTSESVAAKLRYAKPGDLLIATTSEDDEAVAKATAWVGESSVVLSGDAYIYRHTFEPKYVAYFFQSEQFQSQKRRYVSGTKVRRVSGANLAKIQIPVPPLEVQREIVRVLDRFTQLEAELEAELEARRRQYEHYRTKILSDAASGAAQVTLADLGRIVTGRTPKSSDSSAWGTELDFVTPSDIKNGMKHVSGTARQLSAAGFAAMAKARVPAGSLLVTCIGADMGKTVINANDCITNQQINAIIPTIDFHVGYMFHVLTEMRQALRTQGEQGGGTMPLINKTSFSRIEVPLPSLDLQQEAAGVLDNFDMLVNDLSVGLPAELSARRRQYEHYRDRLLTFEEAK
jgi:type I restriction enzyme S subunit